MCSLQLLDGASEVSCPLFLVAACCLSAIPIALLFLGCGILRESWMKGRHAHHPMIQPKAVILIDDKMVVGKTSWRLKLQPQQPIGDDCKGLVGCFFL